MEKYVIQSMAVFVCFLFSILAIADSSTTDSSEVVELQRQSQVIVKQFAGQLKPKLKAAMTKGGPVNAIAVCAIEAPQIAKTLSAETGWAIKRVSLKNRNPEAVPDAWETAAIKQFENQLLQGAEPSELSYGEVVDGQYRFAKAQVTEDLCLACHGQNIHEKTKQALETHYPAENATGYELGEVRGIISLRKILPE